MVTVWRAPTRRQRDHVDRFLESIRDELPELDLTVEGIVDRINGLSRRIKRMMDETLNERSLTWGEWKVLGLLRRSPGHRRSPGYLAVHAELSSGAMTNRLDNLEKAGLIRRLPDPSDRRGDPGRADRGRLAGLQRVDGRAGREGGPDRVGAEREGEGRAQQPAAAPDARRGAARRPAGPAGEGE